jgi:hypothetical protein
MEKIFQTEKFQYFFTPVANLTLVSTTLAKLVEKVAAGVVDTSGAS